jgi:eukaryotic-like serine/threonine-protein kinase
MDNLAQRNLVLRFGPFELDGATGELRENGTLRRLSPQPFRVLLLLAERAGQTVTREEIRHCLWGDRKYVDFERGINFCVNQIRTALRDPAEVSACIKTLPRRGYCFVATTVRISAATSAAGAEKSAVAPESPHLSQVRASSKLRIPAAAVILLALLSIPMSAERVKVHPPVLLTEKDTVVVADFANSTGNGVFDESLKQGLVIELRQSPFVNVLADAKTRLTLKMMGRADTEKLTPAVAREVCVRTGSKAVLNGTISALGQGYALSLSAVACESGDALFNEQGEAVSREDVLKTLNRIASRLRTGLGESLASVHKFDVPIEVTTSSLDALKSYSEGLKVLVSQGDAPSIPFFLRAVELDPNFSMGYVALASRYSNLDQPSIALRYAARAFELRDRVSERERLVIASRYLRLQGELEKLTQTLDMWISEYPRDSAPHGSLGSNYAFRGEYAKALAEWQTAFQLRPDDVSNYENLGVIQMALNRPLDAQETFNSAFAHHLDGGGLRWAAYYLGFVQKNAELMRTQAQWAVGKPGSEDILLSAQADTEAYFGRLARARDLSRRAVDSAIRSDYPEVAALWQVNAALREAEFSANREVRSRVMKALAISEGRNVQVLAALALARMGDSDQAQSICDKLQRTNPHNTVLSLYRLPSIRAAIALSRGNTARALEDLEMIKPYELGQPSPSGLAPLYPAYLRGLVYLSMHNGAAAAVEFNKLLDNPGIALNFAPAALAHLGLARAYALANDTSKAKSAYEDFLLLWKDADSNIPILIAAQKEYAKLLQVRDAEVRRSKVQNRSASLVTNAVP